MDKDYGIEPQYLDTWGHTHTPSPETVKAIAAALSAEQGAGRRETFVLRPDATSIAMPVAIGIPPSAASASATPAPAARLRVTMQWEDETRLAYSASAMEESLPLPAPLRLGYHRISVCQAGETAPSYEAHLIVCPERVLEFEGRAAGVALSLYGLRSARNWGCGDATDLLAAIDVFARAGAAFIALNPLHAIANRQPYNTSPYLPQSSLYRNFLYLDVEKAPGYVSTAWIEQETAALRETEFVEYERVARVKLIALSDAFDRFLEYGGAAEFDAYVRAQGTPLHDFAVFCALDEAMHQRDPNVWLWTQWPAEYRDPRTDAVAEFARDHRARVLFFKFLQWQLDRQFATAQERALERGMPIGLYHDLALATDAFGADLWAYREFYVPGCRVGAPPDDFAPNGQDWGFPPPNREAHRANGYQLFAQSIRNSARHGGALRIDHVMRFFRLFWIPDNLTAVQGAYVCDFADDLLGVLALESLRNRFIVVGEDLGTVTGEVRKRLAESGILSYRLLWFETGAFPEQAAVSTTTHDLPTLAGFALGRDIEARRDAELIDEAAYAEQWESRKRDIERLNDALAEAGFDGDPLGYLLAAPSVLAIVNQEDLTGETEQQNLPASTWQYPNWRRKMSVALGNPEDAEPESAELEKLESDLRELISRSGRSTSAAVGRS